jgi:hypothetical protein
VEKALQPFLVLSYRFQLMDHHLVQVVGVLRCKVAQPVVLQPRPHLLHRIQHGGVGRQWLRLQPSLELGQQFTEGPPLCMVPLSQITIRGSASHCNAPERNAATSSFLK